jgi:hypothetical protein
MFTSQLSFATAQGVSQEISWGFGLPMCECVPGHSTRDIWEERKNTMVQVREGGIGVPPLIVTAARRLKGE